MAYIMVSGGELINASMYHDFTVDVERALEAAINGELEEAGYDPDEVSEEKRVEFAIAAGYNSDHVYADTVDFDPDDEDCLDGDFTTCEGDIFSFSKLAFLLQDDDWDEYGDYIDATDDSAEDDYDEDDYFEYDDDSVDDSWGW